MHEVFDEYRGNVVGLVEYQKAVPAAGAWRCLEARPIPPTPSRPPATGRRHDASCCGRVTSASL